MAIGWGIGDWGGIGGTDDTSGAALDGTAWGGVGDADLGPATIDGITTPLGAASGGGWLADVLGGDVIKIVGSNFETSMVVQILTGASGGPYTVVGTAYIFDPRYDLTATTAYAGLPALAAGTYHVRVTTSIGSAVLENILVYKPFAHEIVPEQARMGFAKVWETGARYLSGNR